MSPSSFQSLVTTLYTAPCAVPGSDEPAVDVRAHLAQRRELDRGQSSCDRALLGGFHADCVGSAFASGYVQAVACLVGDTSAAPAALAVTEQAGGHPRAMSTRLTTTADGQHLLQGEKTFVSLAGAIESVYVVASEGVDAEGRNRLRLVEIAHDAPGCMWSPRPVLPFMPEISHARLRLDEVPALRVLPGDAYARYMRPFRSLEDLHVTAALVGHLLRVARDFALPELLLAELLAVAAGLRALAPESEHAPSTHLALAGMLAAFERCIEAALAGGSPLPESQRQRLERDLAVRFVAAGARAKRTSAASRSLAQPG